jgi:hypothetical protein
MLCRLARLRSRLILALGVTPDVQPGDPSEGARRIRSLMSAGLVGRDAWG